MRPQPGGFPHEYIELLRQTVPAQLIPAFQRLLRGDRIVHVADLAAVKRQGQDDNSFTRAAVEMAGMRTALFVPLRKEGGLLGYFSAARKEVREFTDKEIALFENFAAQAVIAMENARLITETREALEQQTATAEVLGVINSSPGDLAPVFDAMLDKALALCRAGLGELHTYDGERFHTAAVRGASAAYAAARAKIPPTSAPGTGSARILETKRPVHVADLMAEEAYQAGVASRRALVDLGGARTAMAVPLLKDDAVIGMIMIYRQEVRPFTDKQIALLQNFAAQAVIAMENARLITETREALAQQTATAEVLGVINSSPGDLAPVFEAILEKAHALCGATRGSLFLFDSQTLLLREWPHF